MKNFILLLLLTFTIQPNNNVNTYVVDEIYYNQELEEDIPLEPTYLWSMDNVNVREEPNTDSKILNTLSVGDRVELFGYYQDPDWIVIKDGNDVAFVYAEYLSYTEIEPLKYTEYDLYLLSHLIMGEAGSDTCSDLNQRYVASVAINRLNSGRYGDTLEDVIFAPGQYACTWDGNFDREPTQRCIDNAIYILENGSILPDKYIYQSGFPQGNHQDDVIKEQTHYFCY